MDFIHCYTHLDLSRRALNFFCKLYFSIGINGFMFAFLGILMSLGKTHCNVNLDKASNFSRVNELIKSWEQRFTLTLFLHFEWGHLHRVEQFLLATFPGQKPWPFFGAQAPLQLHIICNTKQKENSYNVFLQIRLPSLMSSMILNFVLYRIEDLDTLREVREDDLREAGL